VDNPLAIIAYIAISAVVAICLLAFAPAFLLDYGLAIAWGWISGPDGMGRYRGAPCRLRG